MLDKFPNKLNATGFLESFKNTKKKHFHGIIFQQDNASVRKSNIIDNFFPRVVEGAVMASI